VKLLKSVAMRTHGLMREVNNKIMINISSDKDYIIRIILIYP